MNVMKIALLGTAALAAVSVSARADDLADLKSQIEALNGRISQLESTPSVPAGYQLLSISEADAIIVPGVEADKFYSKKATNIGILPTADVPASTNIQWSGFVRAGVVYNSRDYDAADTSAAFDKDSIDIMTRAGVKVVGTTDTAVGEVGVRIAFLGSVEATAGTNRSHDSSVATDGYWGWWKMTPELTLAAGVDGTLANSSNAFDNRCSCHYIATGGGFGSSAPNDPSQIRLSYGSGPISFAVAVEDYDNYQVAGTSNSSLGVAGEVKWSGDSVGFDMSAGYWDTAAPTGDADWTINAGANLGLGDIASLGVAIGTGEAGHTANDKYTKGSVFLGFTLSDAVSAELGATYTSVKGPNDRLTVAGGLYYTPVSQLTLGIEASYSDTKKSHEDVAAALVSIYRF